MDWIYKIQRHATLTSAECRAMALLLFIIWVGTMVRYFPEIRTALEGEEQTIHIVPKNPDRHISMAKADTLKTKPDSSRSSTKIDDIKKPIQQMAKVKRTININTAQKSQLTRLKGIGPSLAKRIIDYRETHGNFRSIEDITKVKGIGKGKYEAMKDQLSVGT